ncbi:hypothetical protein JKP88DRAFT_319063, partial [Tribonema minus]
GCYQQKIYPFRCRSHCSQYQWYQHCGSSATKTVQIRWWPVCQSQVATPRHSLSTCFLSPSPNPPPAGCSLCNHSCKPHPVVCLLANQIHRSHSQQPCVQHSELRFKGSPNVKYDVILLRLGIMQAALLTLALLAVLDVVAYRARRYHGAKKLSPECRAVANVRGDVITSTLSDSIAQALQHFGVALHCGDDIGVAAFDGVHDGSSHRRRRRRRFRRKRRPPGRFSPLEADESLLGQQNLDVGVHHLD